MLYLVEETVLAGVDWEVSTMKVKKRQRRRWRSGKK